MSKAWASGSEISDTLPLALGRYADGQNTLTVPSAIFISKVGHLFVGAAAERQHESEIESGRQRFDNIKRLLSETEPRLDLNDVPLNPGVDPSNSGLTKGDLLLLYLAWLTDNALKALQEAIISDQPELAKQYSDMRAVRRRFAIPCFEHASDDIPSRVRAEWANELMASTIIKAQIVADTLSNEWEGLTTHRAKRILDEVNATDLSKLTTILADTRSVREPVAAGATQFKDMIERGDSPKARRLLMVVDAGAGTTDFALFQSFYDEGREEPFFALISNSVRMSRVAGNRFDTMLRPLILRACKVHPENGSPWSDE
jgi:molecular chaperone HscA